MDGERPYITPANAITSPARPLDMPTLLTAPPAVRRPPRVSYRRRHPVVSFVLGFLGVIAFFGALAPVAMHKSVPLSTIHDPRPILGPVCAAGTHPVSAVETDNAGAYPLYSVQCSTSAVAPCYGPQHVGPGIVSPGTCSDTYPPHVGGVVVTMAQP